jgi:glutaredoxin
LYGWRADCPYCEKSKELWDSGVKEDQKFAGSFITRKIKYLLNVVPCESQEVKIMVSDPRVVGKPPRWKDGEQEKVFDGSGTLLNIHLAIDKKTYESSGTETYACPQIIGTDATHVTVHRTKPEGSKYEQYSVAIPAIESHQRKLPNYDEFLNERHDLEAFCKEVVVQTLTAEELSYELEKVLNGVTGQTTVNTEPEVGVVETATVAEPGAKNEVIESKPDCYGDYGKLPNGICEKVCKDWQVSCKEASK